VLGKATEIIANRHTAEMGAVRETIEELLLQSPHLGHMCVRQRLGAWACQGDLQCAGDNVFIIGEGRGRSEGAFQNCLAGRGPA
jgi:hypothetical protein